jgi:hypothetical protein
MGATGGTTPGAEAIDVRLVAEPGEQQDMGDSFQQQAVSRRTSSVTMSRFTSE